MLEAGAAPGGADGRASQDEVWMRRALDLAEHGRHGVSPNPMVGCLLVRDGVAVGEGFHERAGGPHAEVVALAQAGPRSAGATAYVTLEPCDHSGRTGPCTRALITAGIRRVVAAVADPHPVAGGGAATLRAAGIRVDVGVCAVQARRQNEVFFHTAATGRPFVVVKAATSLDGRVAAADGSSQWLTGEQARARGHALRAEVDAVLVGSGTVLADDPALTCRLPGYRGPQPLRVVLDRRGRTTADRRVLDGSAPTLVLAGPRAEPAWVAGLRAAGIQVGLVAGLEAGEPHAVLAPLWDRQVRSVLVEGGATVIGAFLRAGLCDKLVVHVAPLLLGAAGAPLLGGGAATLAQAPRLRLDAVERAGGDAILTLYPTAATRWQAGSEAA